MDVQFLIANCDYEVRQADDIGFQRGDCMKIAPDADDVPGYYEVINLRTSFQGLVPKDLVKLVDRNSQEHQMCLLRSKGGRAGPSDYRPRPQKASFSSGPSAYNQLPPPPQLPPSQWRHTMPMPQTTAKKNQMIGQSPLDACYRNNTTLQPAPANPSFINDVSRSILPSLSPDLSNNRASTSNFASARRLESHTPPPFEFSSADSHGQDGQAVLRGPNVRKLEVKGFGMNLMEEELKQFYSQWGHVVDVCIQRFARSGVSRCFGHVTFAAAEMLEAAIAAAPHVIGQFTLSVNPVPVDGDPTYEQPRFQQPVNGSTASHNGMQHSNHVPNYGIPSSSFRTRFRGQPRIRHRSNGRNNGLQVRYFTNPNANTAPTVPAADDDDAEHCEILMCAKTSAKYPPRKRKHPRPSQVDSIRALKKGDKVKVGELEGVLFSINEEENECEVEIDDIIQFFTLAEIQIIAGTNDASTSNSNIPNNAESPQVEEQQEEATSAGQPPAKRSKRRRQAQNASAENSRTSTPTSSNVCAFAPESNEAEENARGNSRVPQAKKADERRQSARSSAAAAGDGSARAASEPGTSSQQEGEEAADDDDIAIVIPSPSKAVSTLSPKLANQLAQLRKGQPVKPVAMIGKDCFAYFDGAWYTATVESLQMKNPLLRNVELSRGEDVNSISVKFLLDSSASGGPAANKSVVLEPKFVAQCSPPADYILIAGSRVVAQKTDDCLTKRVWLAGIVAEEPSSANECRYLIFFDDGYTQYARPKAVYPVLKANSKVRSLDIIGTDKHKKFVDEYLNNYPERCLVRLSVDKTVQVLSNGYWWDTKVLAISASMAKVKFLADSNEEAVSEGKRPQFAAEWIYRGSPRLRIVDDQQRVREQARLKRGHARKSTVFAAQRTAAPLVFDRVERAAEPTLRGNVSGLSGQNASSDGVDLDVSIEVVEEADSAELAQVKLEPGGSARAAARHDRKERVEITRGTRFDQRRKAVYKTHTCSAACLQVNGSLDDPALFRKHRNVNPLLLPLLCGWWREVRDRDVYYFAPCGKDYKAEYPLYRFLRRVDSSLTMDLFSFDERINPLISAKPLNPVQQGEDFSRGAEPLMKIPWVNCINDEQAPNIGYVVKRFAEGNTSLNDGGDFVSCCDCTDDCMDKSKCACQQLTIKNFVLQEESAGLEDRGLNDKGYRYRRLRGPVMTGIYECNDRCRCSKKCNNRVVQNPLQVRLQLFKTPDRGWGIRTLDDLEMGTFVSIYAAQVFGPDDEDGCEDVDDYLASLDYIEVVMNHRYTYSKKRKGLQQASEYRKLFNEEDCYFLNGKRCTNIGRFFNHSCEPNMFVNQVFVDTHDLRFPWIAVFTNELVRAGTELTWDYGYEPLFDTTASSSKKLYCKCGAATCRGRLT